MQLREIIPEYHNLVIQILNNMQRVQNYLHTKKQIKTRNKSAHAITLLFLLNVQLVLL